MITGKHFCMSSNSSVIEIIQNINNSSLLICFIVDDANRLIGSITDGDIRRALIQGFTTDSAASEIMQKSPICILESKTVDEAKTVMQENDIKQLPVVDEFHALLGIHLLDELAGVEARENRILIMAGGFGKRMMPLTENLPKPMLEVAGKPILEHIILNAKAQGFRNFIVSLHYLGSVISDHFGDGSKLDVSIQYINEEEPLGTAGALSLLKPVPALPFIVTNGDILTKVNYANLLDFHLNHKSDATMAIKKYELQNPYGVVHTEGFEISSFQEKPIQVSYVNAGIYVISPSALNYIVKGDACDMPDFLMKLKSKSCRVNAYPVHETWADVGRPIDLSKINAENSEK